MIRRINSRINATRVFIASNIFLDRRLRLTSEEFSEARLSWNLGLARINKTQPARCKATGTPRGETFDAWTVSVSDGRRLDILIVPSLFAIYARFRSDFLA